MKVIWQILMRKNVREGIAKILEVQQQWLEGAMDAEAAVKEIVVIVLDIFMPGVQEPQVNIEVVRK